MTISIINNNFKNVLFIFCLIGILICFLNFNTQNYFSLVGYDTAVDSKYVLKFLKMSILDTETDIIITLLFNSKNQSIIDLIVNNGKTIKEFLQEKINILSNEGKTIDDKYFRLLFMDYIYKKILKNQKKCNIQVEVSFQNCM